MLGLGIELGARERQQWWPAGALYAADFAENRYMRGGAPIKTAEAMAFSRASAKWAAGSDGTWHPFAADILARTELGALIEPTAENGLANTALAGAAPGTTDMLDGLPTGWLTSKVDGASFKGRVLSSGAWLGLPAITLRLWGNSTVSDTTIMFNRLTQMPVSIGDQLLESLFIQMLAGSTQNVSLRLRLAERDAADNYLTKQIYLFTPTAEPGRPLAAFTIASALATQATMALEVSCSGAFDITLRLAAPQLLKSTLGLASSPIITSDSAATRAADMLTLKLPATISDLTLHLADGDTLSMPGVSGNVALDPAQFGSVPLRRAVAMPAA